MYECHVIDLEERPSTHEAATAVGKLWLAEQDDLGGLPVEVRYVNAAGERHTVGLLPTILLGP